MTLAPASMLPATEIVRLRCARTSPGSFSGMGSGTALRIDDVDLAVVAPGVGGGDRGHDIRRGRPWSRRRKPSVP